MDDVILVVSYIALIVAVSFSIERIYHTLSILVTKRAARKTLKKFDLSYQTMPDLRKGISAEVERIFADNIIQEDELRRFAEISLASYIDQDDEVLNALRNMLKSSGKHAGTINVDVLGFYLHEYLNDARFVANLSKNIFSSLSMLPHLHINFSDTRIKEYAGELSFKLNKDFSKKPMRSQNFISPDLFKKLDKNAA